MTTSLRGLGELKKKKRNVLLLVIRSQVRISIYQYWSIVNFLQFRCLTIPRRDLNTKNTKSNIKYRNMTTKRRNQVRKLEF